MQNRFAATKTLFEFQFESRLGNSHEGAVVIRAIKPARVIFALLLPALWLGVSTNCLLDPKSSAGNSSVSLVSSGEHGRHDASDSVSSLERSTRRGNRRFNDSSGAAGAPTPPAISQVRFPEFEPVEAFSVGSQSSFGLAQSKQNKKTTPLKPGNTWRNI